MVRRKKHGSSNDPDLGGIAPKGIMDMGKVISSFPHSYERPSTAPEPIPAISATEYSTGETLQLLEFGTTYDHAQGIQSGLESVTTPRSFQTSQLGNDSMDDGRYHLCDAAVMENFRVGNM